MDSELVPAQEQTVDGSNQPVRHGVRRCAAWFRRITRCRIVPDYPLRQRLALEKEMTGVYISRTSAGRSPGACCGKLPFSTADLAWAGGARGPRLGPGRADGGDGRHSDGGEGQGDEEGGVHGLRDAGGPERGRLRALMFPKVFETLSGHDGGGRFGGAWTGRLSIREEEVAEAAGGEADSAGGVASRRNPPPPRQWGRAPRAPCRRRSATHPKRRS